MFNPQLKFMDGTPVPKVYSDKLAALTAQAALAEEICGVNECEYFTAELRRKGDNANSQMRFP